MGMTAMWVLVAGVDSDAVPDDWEPLADLRPGWLGAVTTKPDQPGILPPDVPATGPATLLSYVEDSGFCVLTVLGGASPHWRWVINEEHFVPEAPPELVAAYGLSSALTGDDDQDDMERAGRRRSVVSRMVEWAAVVGLPEPDPARLDEVLDRQYLPAETGFHELLVALGIRVRAAAPAEVVEEVLPPLPKPEREATDHWVIERSGPRFAFQIDTYADLFGRLDDVADWLERVRTTFVEPAIGRATSMLEVDGFDDVAVPAGALSVRLNTVTMKNRYRDPYYDDRTWRRVVRDVRKGLLRSVDVTLGRYDEAGTYSSAKPAVTRFKVELRSPLVDEPTGPLPNGFPAYFIASVSRPSDELAELVDLLRTTAVTFGAACGYLTADTTGMLGTYGVSDSPYESRSGANTHPYRRLTEITRGVHWGNVFGSGHLAEVGGAAALREHFHRVEPIDGSDLWWLQLAADPEVDPAAVDSAAWALRAVMPRLHNGNVGLTQRGH